MKLDKENRAVLLEKLIPGRHLKELFAEDKERSVDVAIDLMKKLYANSPAQKDFTTVNYWLDKLKKAEESEIPAKYLNKARQFFEKINADKKKIIFIHGDLHHENILSVGKNEFAAIDPFGINANIGYEIGLFLRVHMKWEKEEQELVNAVKKFSDAFELSQKEVKQWTYVQQVLSACWDFEDNGKNWRRELELAEIWEKI